MMMMVMVTMMVNICDDDCDLVMKVILVKEVMSSLNGDVFLKFHLPDDGTLPSLDENTPRLQRSR